MFRTIAVCSVGSLLIFAGLLLANPSDTLCMNHTPCANLYSPSSGCCVAADMDYLTNLQGLNYWCGTCVGSDCNASGGGTMQCVGNVAYPDGSACVSNYTAGVDNCTDVLNNCGPVHDQICYQGPL